MAVVAPPGSAARSAGLNARYGLGGKPAKAVAVKVAKTPAAKVKVVAQRPLTMAEQAAQIADLSINPARTDLSTSISQAEAQRVAGATATAKITEALAHMSAGDAAAARDAYAQAGDAIAGYAKGFTGNLRGGQEAAAAADNARIAGLGSPGGPVVDHASQNADVSYLLGGQMPAESLAKRAASALVTTQDKRYAGGAALADTGLANDYKTEQGIANLRTQLLSLEAKRPGLIQQALASLAQQENQRRATQVQIGTLQLQGAKTLGDQAVAYTNLTGTVHVVKGNKVVDTGIPASGSDAAKTQSQAAIAAARNATAVQTAKIGANERLKAANVAAAATRDAAAARAAATTASAQIRQQAKTGKPPTAQQKASVIKGAQTSGNQIVSHIISVYTNNTPNLAPQQKGEKIQDYTTRHAKGVAELREKERFNYNAILSNVISTIAPQLQVLKWTPAQIHAAALAILSTQIKPPGQ